MNNIFMTVINMSVTGSFVILAVCLARLLLKRAPKSASYLLWLVVGFRLLVPFSIESAFSLVPFNSAQPIPQQFVEWQMPDPPPPQPALGANTDPGPALQPQAAAPGGPNLAASQETLAQASTRPVSWPDVMPWLWLAGVAAMTLYGAISYCSLNRKLRQARRVGAGIYRADNITSPFVMGLFRPRIYLPPHLKAHELEYILLHEQTHISRKDHIVKLLAFFILALHWFNPLAWLSFQLMGKDMEMSCDEQVIRKMGGGIKKDYSMTLLSMATGNRIIGASPLPLWKAGE